MEDINNIEGLVKKCYTIMAIKYGKEATIDNMYRFYNSNNPRLVTRDNDIRNRLVSINFKDNIDNMLKEKNMTFLEYLRFISDDIDLDNEKRK